MTGRTRDRRGRFRHTEPRGESSTEEPDDPWARILAYRESTTARHRRASPWRSLELDKTLARAVAALLNGPKPPRTVAALAVEDAHGWCVLVQVARETAPAPPRSGGTDALAELTRLRTLGACAPYLSAAYGALWPQRWPTSAEEAPAPVPTPATLSTAAQAQVQQELDAAIGARQETTQHDATRRNTTRGRRRGDGTA